MACSDADTMTAAPIRKFLLGEFFNNIGRGYLLVLFTQMLFRESGALWHNLFFIISEVLFSFIVPLIAGIWVDKHGPGRLLFIASSGMVLLAVFSAVLTHHAIAPVGLILVISIASNVFNAAIRLGVFTLTPALTKANSLIQINARQQIAFQGGNLTGVLLAGLLMDHLAMSYSFCLVAAVMTAAVYGYRGATVNASRPDITAPRHHFFALLPHLWRSPMLIMLIILGACDLIAINLFNLLLPLITKYYFNGQSTALSLMDASFTFGAIIMGWYAGRHAIKGRKLHPYLLMMPFALVATIMQIHFFSAALCFLFMLLLGFFVASYSVYFSAAIQALIPSSLRGRFAALRRMISTLLVILSALFFTFSFQHFGMPGAIGVSIVIALMIVGCGIFWMRYRQQPLLSHEDDYHDLRKIVLPFEQLAHASKESVNV
ncbi:MFS transporter [Pantoea ananatis]|uniref:MFS transporter n=1 Tax=Pantoea ananas TaxID=553 RepID=UPI001B3129E4|nr:MFS transporter [Pantoea ananatis]